MEQTLASLFEVHGADPANRCLWQDVGSWWAGNSSRSHGAVFVPWDESLVLKLRQAMAEGDAAQVLRLWRQPVRRD